MFALITLPATLIALVVLLAITAGLERRLAESVRPARLRVSHPLPRSATRSG